MGFVDSISRYRDSYEDFIYDIVKDEHFKCNSYTKPIIIERMNELNNMIIEHQLTIIELSNVIDRQITLLKKAGYKEGDMLYED